MIKDYTILTKDTAGYVIKKDIQTVLENNIPHPQEILVNTKFTIIRFDLYTRRVLVSCKRGGNIFTALFDYDFILNNCFYNENNKNKVIEAIYLPIKNKLEFSLTRYELVVGCAGMLLLGTGIGFAISSLM